MIRQVRGGISRCVTSLVEAFRRQQHLQIEPVLGWRWSDNAHALEAGLTRSIQPRDRDDIRAALRRRAYYLGNGDCRFRARRADGLHHTYYDARS